MPKYDEEKFAEKFAKAVEVNQEGLRQLGRDDSIPQNDFERFVRKAKMFIRRHLKKPKAETVTV